MLISILYERLKFAYFRDGLERRSKLLASASYGGCGSKDGGGLDSPKVGQCWRNVVLFAVALCTPYCNSLVGSKIR